MPPLRRGAAHALAAAEKERRLLVRGTDAGQAMEITQSRLVVTGRADEPHSAMHQTTRPPASDPPLARVRRGAPAVGLRSSPCCPAPRLAILWLLGILGVAARLSAEVAPAIPPSTNLMELSFEQLLEVRVDKVYGASRYEQSVSRAPASVSLITADEIKKFGHRTLAEVLRSVRGINVTDDHNYSYLGFRGFGQPGDYNSRMLLIVDGHRLNENLYDSVLAGSEEVIDVDLIERIEIIRGPSSSIYGNNAFFGVINVITRKGRQLDGVEVSGEAGSFDTYKGRFSVGGQLTNGLEFLFSGTFYRSDGQTRAYFPEFNDPATSYGVARDDDQDQAYRLFGNASWRDFTLTAAYSRREKDVPTASFGSAFNLGRTFTVDRRGYVDLAHQRDLTPDLHLGSRIYYDRYSYNGDYPYNYAAPGAPPELVINRDTAIGDWVGAESQLDWHLFDRHTVIFGAELRENIRQFQKNADVSPRAIYANSDRSSSSIGLYTQAEVALVTNLLLNAGLRYDSFSTFGDTLNPRVGLLYSPLASTTFKLLYGQAYRAPNAYEFYYASGTSFKRNPDLGPERIRTYEAVWEQRLSAQLRLTASGYYYQIRDLISLTQDPADDAFLFHNLDTVNAVGGEWELEGRYANGCSFRTSYALQRAEDGRTGADLANSPRHLAKLNLLMPLFEDKLFAGFEVQYTGGVIGVRRDHLHDYVVANLTLFSQKIVKGVELSGSLYNLFDERYGYPGSSEHIQTTLPQAGRHFRIKLSWQF